MNRTILTIAVLSASLILGNDMSTRIQSARIQSPTGAEIVLSGRVPDIRTEDVSISDGLPVLEAVRHGNRILLRTAPFDVRRNYRVRVRDAGEKELLPDGILDSLVSEKAMGCTRENGSTAFRVFAPRAASVRLELFDRFDDPAGRLVDMAADADGVWEAFLPDPLSEGWYGYRIAGPAGEPEMVSPDVTIADPYGRALATRNHYLHNARTRIPSGPPFDWRGDSWVTPAMEDLVLYEMHVRDMTAHPSSGADAALRGTYAGLVQPGRPGGIDYIASLGVNAVEFLPVQEFANIEIDFKNPALKVYNDWNPYARNHWGYMTSGFFAPESYYASDGSVDCGGWSGSRGAGVNELKEAVRAFHGRGIAVILDVVYNHVSNYDLNPLKCIDRKYYFRLDDDGGFVMASGCGNDLRTERPMARRLIVESLLYWMREYHVDGFRFDLATMIDGATLDAVTAETRRLNPNVILIAEPWGGGAYGQEPFSRRGWGAWNDWFRNGVKGQNPRDGLGFLFGRWQGSNSQASLRSYAKGTLAADGGPFHHRGHSVNYLESHDDHTLGDFIRIGTGETGEDSVVTDRDARARLSERSLALNRLGALFLLTSRGAVMIHEGQEFARSKVVAPTDAPDGRIGRIDHNSYNKDNETNWIRFDHAGMNRPLRDYYAGLIAVRKRHPLLRNAEPERTVFLPESHDRVLAYRLTPRERGEREMVVILNGATDSDAHVALRAGTWSVLADGERASAEPLRRGLSGTVRVPPSSGLVLLSE
jgi:pullulanase